MLDHNYLKHYQLKENDIILDLGACTGEFAQQHLKEIKDNNCLYVAVEPSRWNVQHLNQFLMNELPHNSMLLNTGVWSSEESFKFIEKTANVMNSFEIHNDNNLSEFFGVKSSNEYFAPILSLQTILNVINKPVNFLKCDIEGAELEVFLSYLKHNYRQNILNFAIASYHIIDNERTHIKLKAAFEDMPTVYSILSDDDPDLLFVRIK